MMSSGKIIVSIYSNSFSLERISFMGFDNVFFPIAQIPTITLGLAPMALLNWTPMSGFQVMVFLGMGFLANIGQLGNVMAFRNASASFIAPVKYTGIVLTTFWAFLFWGRSRR